MFTFLLPLLTISKALYTYPKYTRIVIGSRYTEKEINDYFKYYTGDKQSLCKHWESEFGNTYDFISFDDCVDELSSIVAYKYTPGPDLNKVLREVSTVSEIVYIEGGGYDNIDLNNLRDRMKVLIDYEEDDKRDKQFINFARHPLYKRKDKPQPKSAKKVITFNGNIKDKVSYLGIRNMVLNLTSELNIGELQWDDPKLAENSCKIKTDLYISSSKNTPDFIQTKQYGYYENFGYYQVSQDLKKSVITFYNDSWKIVHYNKDDTARETFTLPYSYASKFNPLFDIPNIEIALDEDANLDKYPPLNISLIEYESVSEPLGKLKKHQFGAINIKTNGWSDTDKSKYPEIIFAYDEEMFSYTADKTDLEIQVQKPYQYQPLNRKDDGGSSSSGKGGGKGGKTGMIVGIVIAVVVVVVVAIVVTIIVIRKKKSNQKSESEGGAVDQQEEK